MHFRFYQYLYRCGHHASSINPHVSEGLGGWAGKRVSGRVRTHLNSHQVCCRLLAASSHTPLTGTPHVSLTTLTTPNIMKAVLAARRIRKKKEK